MLDPMRFAELKAAGTLPSPSGAACELIELLGRENVALGEVARVVQVDPALTGRILKLVNSAAFARPRPVAAVTPDVLMSVGLPALRQLVLIFSLVDGQRGGLCAAFDYPAFWSRAVVRGAATQSFGAGLRLAPVAELFTLGLMADIGRLALVSCEPVAYDSLLRQHGKDGAALRAAERDCFGFDHVELTEALLRDWGFPRLFQQAALACEDETLPVDVGEDRAARLACLVRLAQQFAELTELDDTERLAATQRLLPRALALGHTAQNFLTLADNALKSWQDWGAMLGVPTRALTPLTVLEMGHDAPDGSAGGDDAALSQAPLRVLVIDDDSALRRLLETLLGKAGYAVHVAGDGQSGYEEALAWHPHIVITDLAMPRLDGLALTRRLRTSEIGKSLYILALTSYQDEDKLVEAFSAGADDYVCKPVQPRTLMARLHAGVRIVRLQLELAQRNLELAAALRRAEEAAYTDMLTQLPNRRYALERAVQECSAAERSQRTLPVLMIDVDHFKRINDTHGHDVGDAVLKELARRIQAVKRLSDVAARIGGEEFLVLAIDTPLAQSKRLAERIRLAVAQTPFVVGALALPVTVSIGVAEKTADCRNVDRFLKEADDALYAAKAGGRNRVVVARQAQEIT